MIPTLLALIFASQVPASKPAAPAAAPIAVAPAKVTTTFAEMRALIRRLDDARWPVRRQAADALIDLGPACYNELQAAFKAGGSYDFRRRIKQIALESYLTEQLGPPRAFLGISHRPDSNDPRIPAGASALFITDVFKGTAADQAGLRPKDLIFILNDQNAVPERPASSFTAWIASQKRGTPCRLGVLRGGEGIRFQQAEGSPFAPTAFAAAKTQILRHEDDPRVHPIAAALVITDPGDLEARLKIHAGDLIVSLNERLIPRDKPEDFYRDWVQGRLEPAAQLPKPFLRGQAPPNATAPAYSAQILRGGQWKEVELTLGQWPPNLQSGFAFNRTRDYPAAEHARTGFDDWWRAFFDPEGTFQETADLDPAWRLDPQWGGP